MDVWEGRVGCSKFKVYPNPSNENFILKTKNINSTILITDILGKVIYSEKIIQTKTEINIENLPNGVYYLNYKGNTRKLIIQH